MEDGTWFKRATNRAREEETPPSKRRRQWSTGQSGASKHRIAPFSIDPVAPCLLAPIGPNHDILDRDGAGKRLWTRMPGSAGYWA